MEREEMIKKRARRIVRTRVSVVAAVVFLTVLSMFNYHDIRVLEAKVQAEEVESEDNGIWQEMESEEVSTPSVVIPEVDCCPMCGSYNVKIHNVDEDYSIQCEECYFRMAFSSDKKKLIEAWNKGSQVAKDE